jgi:hypothetical protein
MLIARDACGDRERARNLLDHATSTYRELRMNTHAASASHLAHGELDRPPSTVRPS